MQRQAGSRQIGKEKMSLEILYEKVEGLLANSVQKIQARDQTKS
jgi:hypothetical protein